MNAGANIAAIEQARDTSPIDWLVHQGKLSPAAVERGRAAADTLSAERLEFILVRLGLVSDEKIASVFAELTGAERLRAEAVPTAAIEHPRLNARFLRSALIVPLALSEDAIEVAVADPFDEFSLKALRFALRMPLTVRVAALGEIETLLDRFYGSAAEDVTGVEQDEDGFTADSERLRDMASEAPVIRLVSRLIEDAVERGASDIHIEPFENKLKVRFRLDGMLREIEDPPAQLSAAIVSRIKILAKLNIAERRLPQDGRIRIAVKGKEVDFRVSTAPTVHGESVVLRILDRSQLTLDFHALGFDEDRLQGYLNLLSQPHGIVLVTGPTGSGKTTTLYASLDHLNQPDRKILTVEDPVEYMLEGVNQVQVHPEIGRGFASTLRSFLRQDPDILMVGEIRDIETARIAVQSALTGHLVLSTVHTNDAAGGITRLLDMGVEDFLLMSTVIGLVGQRLIRCLCPHCRQPYEPAAETRLRLGLNGDDRLFHAGGCLECGGTGYAGRTALLEVLPVTDGIRALILEGADAQRIRDMAIAQGMVTMFRDGIAKARAGMTSLEEVYRVAAEA